MLDVTKLLYYAALVEYPNNQDTLKILPAAKDVAADCIFSLLINDTSRHGGAHSDALLRLPNAKQIGSQQLCNLLFMAGRSGHSDFVQQLSR